MFHRGNGTKPPKQKSNSDTVMMERRELEMQPLSGRTSAAAAAGGGETRRNPQSYHYLRYDFAARMPRGSWIWMGINSVVFLMIVIAIARPSSENGKSNSNGRPVLMTTIRETSHTFQILQITDLHLGEAEDESRGPIQDEQSYQSLHAVITAATQQQEKIYNNNIDLIVLSGDQLSASRMHSNATAYQRRLSAKMESYQIPWCIIFGNHDDAPELDDKTTRTPILTNKRKKNDSKIARQELARVDQSFPHSLTQIGPENIHGVSNYVLNVQKQGASEVLLQLLFLDTGGGSTPKALESSQQTWWNLFRSPSIPGVLIEHIPTPEFRFERDACAGDNLDGGFDAIQEDFGLMNSLDENMALVVVGHMHGSDYCCPYSTSLSLCFGRHTGYGGYEGLKDRGARVYEFDFGKDGNTFSWKSHVQLESGSVTSDYVPK